MWSLCTDCCLLTDFFFPLCFSACFFFLLFLSDFFGSIGDVFSVHSVPNPDPVSEFSLLRSYGPSVPSEQLEQLVDAFGELRHLVLEGTFTYPYSTRELVAIVRHLQANPNEGIGECIGVRSIRSRRYEEFERSVCEAWHPAFVERTAARGADQSDGSDSAASAETGTNVDQHEWSWCWCQASGIELQHHFRLRCSSWRCCSRHCESFLLHCVLRSILPARRFSSCTRPFFPSAPFLGFLRIPQRSFLGFAPRWPRESKRIV